MPMTRKDFQLSDMFISIAAIHEAMEEAQDKPATWRYAMNTLPHIGKFPCKCGQDDCVMDATPMLDTDAVFDIIADEIGEEKAKALVVDTPDEMSCACKNHR